jgi:hypothetical protein
VLGLEIGEMRNFIAASVEGPFRSTTAGRCIAVWTHGVIGRGGVQGVGGNDLAP